jgi:hypothetical protein
MDVDAFNKLYRAGDTQMALDERLTLALLLVSPGLLAVVLIVWEAFA